MEAIFKRLSDAELDMIAEECDLNIDDIEKIKAHFGCPCSVEISVEGDRSVFDRNYYDAKFDDGYEMKLCLSGKYFSRVDTPKELADRIANAIVMSLPVKPDEVEVSQLESYEVKINGKRHAIIDIDGSCARLVTDKTTNFMSVDALIAKIKKGTI